MHEIAQKGKSVYGMGPCLGNNNGALDYVEAIEGWEVYDATTCLKGTRAFGIVQVQRGGHRVNTRVCTICQETIMEP